MVFINTDFLTNCLLLCHFLFFIECYSIVIKEIESVQIYPVFGVNGLFLFLIFKGRIRGGYVLFCLRLILLIFV